MTTNAGAQFRILVVDDEQYSRHVVAKLFESLGASGVAFAASGAEARSAMAADPSIRLVISDHYMPDETGIRLLGDLRQGRLPLPHDTYFIVATASTSFVLTAVALSLDVDSFLSKPFGKDALARRLYQFLGNSGRSIKTPEHYQTFDVPAMLAAAEMVDPAAPKPARPAVPMTPLAKVPSDTLLTADLTAEDGSVILYNGTQLTRHLMGRLVELGVKEVPITPAPKDEKAQAGRRRR